MQNEKNDRLLLTSGFLSLPTDSSPRWFRVFVLDTKIHLEVVKGEILSHRGPEFLLNDIKERGYILPTKAIETIERFMVSGANIITAMQKSIRAEMAILANRPHTQSRWVAEPEKNIWLLVKEHVPDDIQLAIYALLKCYRHNITEDGKIEIKRGDQ